MTQNELDCIEQIASAKRDARIFYEKLVEYQKINQGLNKEIEELKEEIRDLQIAERVGRYQ